MIRIIVLEPLGQLQAVLPRLRRLIKSMFAGPYDMTEYLIHSSSSYVLNAARLAKHDDSSKPQRVVYLSVSPILVSPVKPYPHILSTLVCWQQPELLALISKV